MKDKKVFVSIAGNIGSGKSSLTDLIAKEFDWKPYYEKVNDEGFNVQLMSNSDAITAACF